MAEEIDEAGRDDLTFRVDRRLRRVVRQIADRCDRIAANADIAAHARVAGAVDHVTVDDANVVIGVRRACRLLRRNVRCMRRSASEREESCESETHRENALQALCFVIPSVSEGTGGTGARTNSRFSYRTPPRFLAFARNDTRRGICEWPVSPAARKTVRWRARTRSAGSTCTAAGSCTSAESRLSAFAR